MDADQSLNVGIKIGLEGKENADQARASLESVKSSTTELSKEVDKSVISQHELRKVMTEIGNSVAPGMGHALAELAFGPVGAALAIGSAFEMVRDRIKETNAEMDKMGEKAANAFSNLKANLFDTIEDEEFSTDKIDAYFNHIEERAKRTKAAIDAALGLTKAQDTADQDTNKSAEALALERVKNNPFLSPDQKTADEAAIRANYAQKDAAAKIEANNAEVKAARDERDATQAELNGLVQKQHTDQAVSPEAKARVDAAVSGLKPTDALRIAYDKDKAAGTLDYSKILNGANSADVAAQIEAVKKQLGLDPQTGEMAEGGDAKRLADAKAAFDSDKDANSLRSKIGDLQDHLRNPNTTADERGAYQNTVNRYQSELGNIRNEHGVDQAQAMVNADKERLEQLSTAQKAIVQGIEEQKKLNEAISAQRAKVEDANGKLDAITKTTVIKNDAIATGVNNTGQAAGETAAVAEWMKNKGIADRVTAGKTVSAGDEQRLMAGASAIAGHQLNLNDAATVIETGARNMAAYVQQMQRLGQALSGFGPNSDLAQRLANLEAVIKNIQRTHGQ